MAEKEDEMGGKRERGREEMRELSVKAYTASIASFHQSIIHKSFSSQTLGKQGWVGRGESGSGCSSSSSRGGGATGGGVSGEAQRDRGTIGLSRGGGTQVRGSHR